MERYITIATASQPTLCKKEKDDVDKNDFMDFYNSEECCAMSCEDGDGCYMCRFSGECYDDGNDEYWDMLQQGMEKEMEESLQRGSYLDPKYTYLLYEDLPKGSLDKIFEETGYIRAEYADCVSGSKRARWLIALMREAKD